MLTRRQILFGSIATVGAGATSIISGADAANAYREGFAAAQKLAGSKLAKSKLTWHGKHQAGIESRAQAHTNFVALNILPNITADDMLRWMVLLTDNISTMCAGIPALADPQPDVFVGAANLSITVGFGPSLFKKLKLESNQPASFDAIPKFSIDELQSEYCDGDVLLHIAADDLQIMNHVTRTLISDSKSFAKMHWLQNGFTNAVGTVPEGVTQRNLMGQVDGTDNPELGTENFAQRVWIDDGPAWIVGGTQLALRRIRMNLNTWDLLGRTEKEAVIGRHLDTGAPLGKTNERDAIDFEAVDDRGLKVIPEFAHIRRAASQNLDEIFFRRPFNYQVLDASAGQLEAGLLWTAYARDLSKQYLPVQRRLAQFDLLNKWTTPIGSATFAIARGIDPGEIIAEELFS
ncbi:Dyp-type peroxidase [Rhodoluna sp.]|uniref:Dyp-type peroxidase n=1 Tax=Rhodoluna sp. TaxID=1969481 RepID=UPI0025F4BB15|nr:Dyp-type peroxidase [Rhodoluna sp.]